MSETGETLSLDFGAPVEVNVRRAISQACKAWYDVEVSWDDPAVAVFVGQRRHEAMLVIKSCEMQALKQLQSVVCGSPAEA